MKVRLEIVNIDGYLYYLKSEDNKKFVLNLEFVNVDYKLQNGDYIWFAKSLLEEKNSTYTFGDIESEYGRANFLLNDTDVIKIETKDKEIFLKRLYG